ncbi:MAG: aldehyde ferredoxin oxidoreductase family protein [Dehalococcoidales bacterium]|nr:aldehyde ferredoxin oxidoreductase family protein [Dehalococcoidales bacterium]
MKQEAEGYSGKLLRVNLTDNSLRTERIGEELYRKYLGGAGFVAYFLWKELPTNADPLGPENKLIFAVGPLTGIPLSGSGRNCIGAKSPLTGGVAKSEVGEFWGYELKRAGYDVIVVEGKAEKPVYLWIHDGEVSLEDARQLWGQDTKETQQGIRDKLRDKLIRVASIGPAGENLVRYACIMNGLYDAAGRGGVGAVMGSKNLKAIAVRGKQPPKKLDAEVIKSLKKWLASNRELTRGFWEVGTGIGMDGFEAIGNLPVRNFRGGVFPAVKDISARAVMDNIGVGMDACYACTIRCKKIVKVESPYNVDPAYGGPEYETLASLGSNCGIDNLAAIARGSQLCNAYSLDTISVGEVISFAMECFENGLLNIKDTGGIDLRFGSEKAMLQLLERIARREGIGNVLAEGVSRAAQVIGNGAEEYAIAVKGLEAGMHEPRAKPGLGLGFMVNPHGADHCCNLHDHMYLEEDDWRSVEVKQLGMPGPVPVEDIGPDKVRLVRHAQLRMILYDSLVMCQFLPYNLTQVNDLLISAVGWDTGVNELLEIAERTLTTLRLINMREGFSADDDCLPRRFYQPKTDGILSDKPLDPVKMEKARRHYYSLMGWDEETGVPRREKLAELGIA